MAKLYSILLLAIVTVHTSGDIYGQVKGPSDISASLFSSVSSKEYQPLWLVANREGIYEEFSKANGVLSFQAESALDPDKLFDYSYGVNLITRAAGSSSKACLNEFYVSMQASIFQLDIGRKSRVTGETTTTLSSGSLAIGRNTTPIPMVNISVPDFTPIPFTQKLLKFKGNLAHGWLGDDPFVKGAYLHEKSFYLQGGKNHWPVQPYTGLINFAQWGGTSSNPDYGKLPSGFDDYISVVLGKGGASDSPEAEQSNALGNHLGIWDYGIDVNYRSFKLKIYYQHPFEDESGLLIRSLEDGLWGINLKNSDEGFFSELVWELIYTKSQSGAGISDPPGDFPFCEEENCGFPYGGRDDYYNHFIYNGGWMYNGRTLGTPLFLTVAQVQSYLSNPEINKTAIISNRIVGQHVGVSGKVTPGVDYRVFMTYVRHYGNYNGLNGYNQFNSKDPDYDNTQYDFYPALQHLSFMAEIAFELKQLPEVDLNTTFAYDTGDLTNNAGLLLGATWNF